MGADRLIFLGTKGGAALVRDGAWPTSHVLVVAGRCYVIDAGLGVVRQYVQAGLDFADLAAVFITHHHSDHNLELGGLLYTAWNTGLCHEVAIRGPKGLKNLLRHFWASQQFDIDMRVGDEGLMEPMQLFPYAEYSAEYSAKYSGGEIYTDAHMRVSALRVLHPPVAECYALKVEAADKVIVFGADTRFYPPLAEFAKSADILVHEAMYVPGARKLCAANKAIEPNLWAHFESSHSSCEDAGRIASLAGCKRLVINHHVPQIGALASRADYENAVRTTYQGEVIIAYDLCEIAI